MKRPHAALVAAALLLAALCAMVPSAQATRLAVRHRTREMARVADFDDSDDGSDGALADSAVAADGEGEGEGDGLSVGAMDAPSMDGSGIDPFASAVEVRELGEERDQIASDPGQAPLDAVTELDTPDLLTGGEASELDPASEAAEAGYPAEDAQELDQQEQEEQGAYQGDEQEDNEAGAGEARDALEGREDEAEMGDDEGAAQEMAQDQLQAQDDGMALPENEYDQEQEDQAEEQDYALIQLSEGACLPLPANQPR